MKNIIENIAVTALIVAPLLILSLAYFDCLIK